MQNEEHNNGQRSPPSVPKTGPYLQRIIKVVLGCQTINGINQRSAIRQQQQQQHIPPTWHNTAKVLNVDQHHHFLQHF
jgi:hypothetical protein